MTNDFKFILTHLAFIPLVLISTLLFIPTLGKSFKILEWIIYNLAKWSNWGEELKTECV